MQQQISVITLGIVDLDRSRRFYVDGFGWSPVFENEEIAFYQMNDLVLGTFRKAALEVDMNRTGLLQPGAFSLAHNVPRKEDVAPVMDRPPCRRAEAFAERARSRVRPGTRGGANA